MADPAHFCCTIQVECCAQSRSTPTPNLRLDPVLNESGAPNVINTQPAPKNGSMKESSVEGALSLSTTTDLPTTPTRVYVRVFVPLVRSHLFILFLGLLGSESCSQISRAPSRYVYRERLFRDNFCTVPRYRKNPHSGQHASLVTLVVATRI